MTPLSRLLVFPRFARRKIRVLFLLLAIVTASCLVVWTVGGYQSLFTEAMKEDGNPLGRYDLKIGANPSARPGGRRGAGGGFGGPLARRPSPTSPTSTPSGRGENATAKNGDFHSVPQRYDPLQPARVRDGSIVLDRLPEKIPNHIRKRLIAADKDGNGVLSLAEERTFYPEIDEEPESPPANGPGMGGPGARRGGVVIPESVIEEIENDPEVQSCDRFRSVRAFLFAEKSLEDSAPESPTTESMKKPDRDNQDASVEEPVPDGIDPDLHRRGMALYRASMGTPMALGSEFIGTDATIPPFDLEEGRWFPADRPNAREVVLGQEARKRYHADLNDKMWVLTKTGEFQLTVVGFLDEKNGSGIYVPMGTANEIANSPPVVDSVGVVLTRSASIENFKAKLDPILKEKTAGASLLTVAEARARQEAEFKAARSFKLQAMTGSLLAILAAMMIIFTALSTGVEERRREIALTRAIGLFRRQIALSILTESLLLAIPGWLGGVLAGWLILCLAGGKGVGLNPASIGFSFLCAVIGSLIAAIVPTFSACRVQPLEAVADTRGERADAISPKKRLLRQILLAVTGFFLLGFDLWIIYGMKSTTEHRAVLHSGLGMIALIFGVLFLIPLMIQMAESFLFPILAFLLRFDRTISATEFSRNARRSVGVTAMLTVGGGLFVLTQVWGYSMLGPFLPNDQMPDAFAAFLPVGLTEEHVTELRNLPMIRSEEFEPVALEQAAFAPDSIPSGKGGDFANVVFFGMDVDRAFAGNRPLVTLRFIDGDKKTAFESMKNGRGVVITDSLRTDYGLQLGDVLKVCDPKNPSRTLEYPIVGIVTFNGWQWLSKTSGVRRNFGRSGGIVFASADLIASDYHIHDASYFWFNLTDDAHYSDLETALDTLARKNLRTLQERNEKENPSEGSGEETHGRKKSPPLGNAAYAKLSTRESLTASISGRADNVIWGLSTMPLITLALMSIALVAVMVNSVRTRRQSFGILRAIGVDRSKIVRMILAESILLGLTAAGASFLFGVIEAAGALKLGQSMFGTADPEMILPLFGLSFGLGLLVLFAILAAIVPAIQMGTTPPLDLLQRGRSE